MVDTRTIASEYRLSQWAEIMRQRKESGLSIRAYCKSIGLHENSYYYWLKKLRETACEQLMPNRSDSKNSNLPMSIFTEVRVAEAAAQPALTEADMPSRLHIEISSIQMVADSTYPPEKLAALLREMLKPC